MHANDARVTARIVRTEDVKNYTEYRVSGFGYGSLNALEALLDTC